jgi:hypothetical protein
VAVTPKRPDYKGAPLDAGRGPGLGCFWIQLGALIAFIVLTPIAVMQGQPISVTGTMLVGTLVLLFFTGQTAIFLLRLVAADRRARRRPLGSASRTVGELEDEERRRDDPGTAARDEAAEPGDSMAERDDTAAARDDAAVERDDAAR